MTTNFVTDLNPVEEPTMSVDRFAQVVGISRGSAFNAVKNGEVPSLRFGRRIRIPTAAVKRMLDGDPA